jgi:hypothetical protein
VSPHLTCDAQEAIIKATPSERTIELNRVFITVDFNVYPVRTKSVRPSQDGPEHPQYQRFYGVSVDKGCFLLGNIGAYSSECGDKIPQWKMAIALSTGFLEWHGIDREKIAIPGANTEIAFNRMLLYGLGINWDLIFFSDYLVQIIVKGSDRL